MPNFDLCTATDIEPCMAIMRVAGDPEAVAAAVENGACVVCAAATADLSSPSRAAVDGTPAVPAREATTPAAPAVLGERGDAGAAGTDRPLPGAGLRPGSGLSTSGGAS